MPFNRVAGIGGIAFAALIVLANIILAPSGFPHAGTATTEVVGYFTTSAAAIGGATALIPAAWIGASVFAVGVLLQARRASDTAIGWTLLGVVGVVLQNATFAGVVAIRLGLATADRLDAALVDVVWTVHDALFTLNGTFLATALIGLSLGGIHGRMVTRWHAGLGVIAAGLLFISATLSPLVVQSGGVYGLLGLAGWVLWVVWIVIYAIGLLRTNPDW